MSRKLNFSGFFSKCVFPYIFLLMWQLMRLTPMIFMTNKAKREINELHIHNKNCSAL